MQKLALICLFLFVMAGADGAEETIRGTLERTTKPGACAQITDALNEVYYVLKSDDSEKAVAEFVGKNIKVVIKGVVEAREGDPAYFFNLKSIARYVKPDTANAAPPKDVQPEKPDAPKTAK